MHDRTRYEHKTIKAVRGTDRLVVAKWEKRGWELVDQTQGKVSTNLAFRRPKPRVTWRYLALGALLIALAGAITVGVLTERDDPGEKASAPDASPLSTSDAPVRIVKNDSYTSDDDLVAAAAQAGFTCPSPTKSGASLESAPKYIVSCSNDRTLISLGGTITGANAREVFILGLEDGDFGNGPWLVGADWALNGPGVADLQPVMGGKLVREAAAWRFLKFKEGSPLTRIVNEIGLALIRTPWTD